MRIYYWMLNNNQEERKALKENYRKNQEYFIKYHVEGINYERIDKINHVGKLR